MIGERPVSLVNAVSTTVRPSGSSTSSGAKSSQETGSSTSNSGVSRVVRSCALDASIIAVPVPARSARDRRVTIGVGPRSRNHLTPCSRMFVSSATQSSVSTRMWDASLRASSSSMICADSLIFATHCMVRSSASASSSEWNGAATGRKSNCGVRRVPPNSPASSALLKSSAIFCAASRSFARSEGSPE